MDKYEYNVKLEQIKKLIRKKDYATAARIADTIDWYKVKNNQTIVLIADVYEASGRYEQDEDLLKAYLNMAPSQTLKWIECGKNPSEQDVEIQGTEPYIVAWHMIEAAWADRLHTNW